MAAEHEGGHVLDRDVELLGQEVAEAGRVQHAGHADDLLRLQAGELLQRPHHGVERVGDADHEGVGGILLDAVADRFHDLEVDADEVVAAHAGLARHAGGHDDHVGARDVGVVVRALVLGVEPVDRRGFGDVETFALGNALRDVEENDVAEFLQADEMGERAADLAGADERDLVTGHGMSLSFGTSLLRWRCLTERWAAFKPQKVKGKALQPSGKCSTKLNGLENIVRSLQQLEAA